MHNSVHGRICQIDAAISDAPKPIGWELCVRASYYLDVGTCPAHPVPPYSTTGTPWSCTNVSPTPRAREKSESPPHTNTEKLEQKSEFRAQLESRGGIGSEIRIAGLLPGPRRGWNNFDRAFLKVSSRPFLESGQLSILIISLSAVLERFVKRKSLNNRPSVSK